MKWYENLLQIINEDLYTNYINFLKKETGQEQLDTFWKELYGYAIAWDEKYHINNKNYELYTTCGSGAFWHIDEFVFGEEKANVEYLYILFFLSHFDGRTVAEEIKSLEEDNENSDWTDLFMGNDVWEEDIPSTTLISENDFLEEISKYLEKSFIGFQHRNEKYGNDSYAKKIAPQYTEIEKYISFLKDLEGKKTVIKINEFKEDVPVRYFIQNNNIMYTIRIDEYF